MSLAERATLPSVRSLLTSTSLLIEAGASLPAWDSLAPPPQPEQAEDFAPSLRGWQQVTSAAVDARVSDTLSTGLDPASQAMLCSQSGPFAARVLTLFPTSPELVLEPAIMRALLLRRLRLPLALSSARCRCGRPHDVLGDHRASCPRSGALRARAGALERAAARVCREAGATVNTHMLLRDLNVQADRHDDRRLEVVANGLPLWGGVQLAVDTTLVSALTSAAQPRRYRGTTAGAALALARRDKERTYPELVRMGRCRLVVFAVELGGRWSTEAAGFVRQLARAKARSSPPLLRAAATSTWVARWSALLSAAAARAFAASLLALPASCASNLDGAEPLLSEALAAHSEAFAQPSRLPGPGR